MPIYAKVTLRIMHTRPLRWICSVVALDDGRIEAPVVGPLHYELSCATYVHAIRHHGHILDLDGFHAYASQIRLTLSLDNAYR